MKKRFLKRDSPLYERETNDYFRQVVDSGRQTECSPTDSSGGPERILQKEFFDM